MINRIIKLLSVIFFLSSTVFAQTEDESFQKESGRIDSVFVQSKSPWGAVLRSAVVPGWGQLYNESYWKVPVIWGISGWLMYEWIQNNKSYTFYRDEFIKSPVENYKRLRNIYRDQRDLFAIYLGITYLLTLTDAYVDAQLFDFDVKEDLQTRSLFLQFKISF